MVGGWLSKALILADLVGSEAANAVASKQLVGRYAPVERKDSSIVSGI